MTNKLFIDVLSRSPAKRISSIAAWIFLAALIGCSKPLPPAKELIGEWVGTNGYSKIILQANGTFEAQSFPEKVFFGKNASTNLLIGAGKWEIEEFFDNKKSLRLRFTSMDGTNCDIGFHPFYYHPDFRFYIGDPDSFNIVTFRKKTQDSPKNSSP